MPIQLLSPPLALRARGPFALFSDPALKAERVTVPVMTPTAAQGVLSAVLWKPAIEWRIERIKVLAPIRFTSIRRNEVNSKAQMPSAAAVASGGSVPQFYADEDRSQRNAVLLRDVDYVIEARFAMTPAAGPGDNVTKFAEMFRRRVDKGQCFTIPYLGAREFAADVSPADGAPSPIAESRELGRILWWIDYSVAGRTRPHFFEAKLVQGILEVPPPDQANGGPA
jgi:CRISPR-associated protein Cas5d